MSQPILDDGLVTGNVYDKYGTRNPIARWMVGGFLDAFRDLAQSSGADRALEAGCGEGRLSLELARLGMRVRASDVSPKIIDIARRTVAAESAGDEVATAIELEVRSLFELTPARDAAPLVVCCEVLEHVDEPERALDVLASLASPHLLVSVPREPLWRVLNMARGRYLRDFGNTPGHVQHWSRRGFLDLLERRVEVVAVRSPLPWTMALCRTQGDGA
ncbi:MAG: methyltransferase domain-containing protein [Acidobacteriota bacterium]